MNEPTKESTLKDEIMTDTTTTNTTTNTTNTTCSTNGNTNSDTETINKHKNKNDPSKIDPYQKARPPTVQDGDFVLLHFSDGRQIFAEVLTTWRGKSPPLKINKRNYDTRHLVGLPYGTVLELNYAKKSLLPLECGEGLIPDDDDLIEASGDTFVGDDANTDADTNINNNADDTNNNANDNTNTNSNKKNKNKTPIPKSMCSNDNRNLIDDNKSQSLTPQQLTLMVNDPTVTGRDIVATTIRNSSTFSSKTAFSRAKYLKRKQIKYQPRCRMVRCTASSICQAFYLKDAKRMMNLREDSLAQILSYGNVCAGRRVVMMDQCMGVLTGAVAERMGGYGSIVSLFTANSPPFIDMIARFNLSFVEFSSIKWLHAGEIFHPTSDNKTKEEIEEEQEKEVDHELKDRSQLQWPCHLQPHTRTHVETMSTDVQRSEFLMKRCARFARKLTRPTTIENRTYLKEEGCDSLLLACRYDPTETLLNLLPYLESSCPFVVYSEYMEPLMECFKALQDGHLAINLRLSDTWMRDYQVLPGRTHPNMTMSQNGGFILTGTKLDPVYGRNELEAGKLKELKAIVGGRRNSHKRGGGGGGGGGKKRKADVKGDDSDGGKNGKQSNTDSTTATEENKDAN